MFNASGDVDWTRASFLLSAGSHVLTFRYQKDYSVSNGSDCAWIDNVVLPHKAHAVTFVHIDTCSNDTPAVQSNVAANGDVTIVEYTTHPAYNVSDEIVACDSYLWEDVEYTSTTVVEEALQTVYGCDSIVGLTITINHSTVGDTLYINTQALNFTWNGVAYDSAGTYQQTLTNSVGCDSTAFLVLTFGNTQGIGDVQNSELGIQVYPNPTTGWLHLSQEVDGVTVYDLTGRMVAEYRRVDTIDLGDLAPGVYTLRLTSSGATAVRRVVKR